MRTRKHRGVSGGGRLLAGLVAAGLLGPPAWAGIDDGFNAPDMTGFRLTHEEDGDGDGDSVKETHIRHYANGAGARMFSMVTRGRLWAWSLEGADGDTDAAHNYVILDTNCDGAFDKRYSLDQEFHVPECLKSPN